ncbi:MAG: hypothetical protein ACRC2T_18840 [Thermoguttaceae bacterium]
MIKYYPEQYLNYVEYRCAVVAAEVYSASNIASLGLPFATDSQINEIFSSPFDAKNILLSESNGFRARLYHDMLTEKFILGFGGTVPKNPDDWITNFRQWNGKKAEQYERGIVLSNNIKPHFRNKVVFVGHSLGGGIATVAAALNGTEAVVFNPPGIHTNSIPHINLKTETFPQIRRFVVRGEILNLINHIPFRNIYLVGQTVKLTGSFTLQIAKAAETVNSLSKILRHPLLIRSASIVAPFIQKTIDLHCMPEVFIGLEKWIDQHETQQLTLK